MPRVDGRSFLDGMYVPEGIWLAPCLYTMVAGVRKLAKKVRPFRP